MAPNQATRIFCSSVVAAEAAADNGLDASHFGAAPKSGEFQKRARPLIVTASLPAKALQMIAAEIKESGE